MLIRFGQNNVARPRERGKNTRQTEEEEGTQHQEMDRTGVRKDEDITGKMEECGCQIICGAPTTLAVKGQLMMTMTE